MFITHNLLCLSNADFHLFIINLFVERLIARLSRHTCMSVHYVQNPYMYIYVALSYSCGIVVRKEALKYI